VDFTIDQSICLEYERYTTSGIRSTRCRHRQTEITQRGTFVAAYGESVTIAFRITQVLVQVLPQSLRRSCEFDKLALEETACVFIRFASSVQKKKTMVAACKFCGAGKQVMKTTVETRKANGFRSSYGAFERRLASGMTLFCVAS
jgi:hypothetical protein